MPDPATSTCEPRDAVTDHGHAVTVNLSGGLAADLMTALADAERGPTRREEVRSHDGS